MSRLIPFQFSLPLEAVNRIDALMRECKFASYLDLFSACISLFEHALKAVKCGKTIAIYDPITDEVRTLTVPCFEHLKPKAPTPPEAPAARPTHLKLVETDRTE